MLIPKEKLNEIRKKVEEQLSQVPEGQKIKLPKETLEILIFDNYVAKMESYSIIHDHLKESVPFKMIAWNMKHYDKLDLSEVSFDNVYWGDERILYCTESISPKINEGELKFRPIIDLSNTNAKIDFLKAIPIIIKKGQYKDKHHNVRIIYRYNFDNTDLSNNLLSSGFVLKNTFLRNTNINISFNNNYFVIDFTDLSNVDLSNNTVTEKVFSTDEDEPQIYISNSVLKNTGLNISLPSYKDVKTNDVLNSMILSGNLKGCYINGKVVGTTSKEEREAKKQQLLEELVQYQTTFEDSIICSIQKQLSKK